MGLLLEGKAAGTETAQWAPIFIESVMIVNVY